MKRHSPAFLKKGLASRFRLNIRKAAHTGRAGLSVRNKAELRLGGFVVQRRLNRVVAGRRVTRMEPKVMKLLLCFAEKAGEVLSRRELMACVWPGTHVTDDALRRAVAQLRGSLHDNSRRPRLIETIPLRGRP